MGAGMSITDKVRSWFERPGDHDAFPPPGLSSPRMERKMKPTAPEIRNSRGLEQFVANLRDLMGLNILDLAGANQENISFLTNLGHRVYSMDLPKAIENAFGTEPAGQATARAQQDFLDEHFNYLPDTFDGVLLWDSLQYMSPSLLQGTIDRIHHVTTPKASLLAFFNADERALEVPSYAFRILDPQTVSLTLRGMRVPGQTYNNRNIEKAFGRFDSVKLFLTKDNLREVVVRR